MWQVHVEGQGYVWEGADTLEANKCFVAAAKARPTVRVSLFYEYAKSAQMYLGRLTFA